MVSLQEAFDLLQKMNPAELARTKAMLASPLIPGRWQPFPGRQHEAFNCLADILFYGGQAGGGKTDLIVGLSLTLHERSLVLRRTNKEASKLFDRYFEILRTRDGWNGQDNVWRLPDGKVIDIGGCQHEDDKQKYKGTPHDLICFDEISDFTETQFRFVTAWNRSTVVGQRCRVVATGNPPTTPEGLWVLKYWGPWLDDTHPNPARPGELRWFTTVNDKDQEVDGPGPHLVDGLMVRAQSRTFIRATLDDNPYLRETNYKTTLAALPAELRAAYMEGRFYASLRDDEWQVIPTEWIMAAQRRWTPEIPGRAPMAAMGLDVAQGGEDKSVLVWRHDGWFAKPYVVAGALTPNPSDTAGMVVARRRNGAAVIVDIGGGYGGGVLERLKENGISAVGFNGTMAASGLRTADKVLKFVNKRALAWWRFREALDPDQEFGSAIALPDDPAIRADLAAPHWKMTPRGIQIEEKLEIKKRLGRSPDIGDAIVMAWDEGQKALRNSRAVKRQQRAIMGYEQVGRRG